MSMLNLLLLTKNDVNSLKQKNSQEIERDLERRINMCMCKMVKLMGLCHGLGRGYLLRQKICKRIIEFTK